MKATGIVRRIDDYVIIGARSESFENTGVSLILSNLTSQMCAMLFDCDKLRPQP